MKKVAGYIRVSTLGQAEEGESLNTQTEQIKSFAKGKGWKLTKIYEDRGISGSKAENRPGFMGMMKAAEQGQFDGIIFSRLSRFARNAGDFLHYRDKLKNYSASIFSIKENIDPTTNTGKLMMGLMALIAEWEREMIREQMDENKKVKWKNNTLFMGKPPYGYVWNKEKKALEINQAEKEIYLRIVDMYLNLGMSMKNIALKLKDEGIKCKKKYFSSATISYALKNPAYYGNYLLNQYVYETGKRGIGTKRTNKLKPASEHINFKIPAMISKIEWDKIQQKTSANKIRSKRSSDVTLPYWLRDLLECGHCGARVKPHHGSKRKDGTFPRYYSCHWSTASPQTLALSNRDKKCRLPILKAESLEAAIWQGLTKPFTFDRKKELLAQLIDPAQYEVDIKALDEKINRLENELKRKQTGRDRIYELIEDDSFDVNELKRRLKLNQDEILETSARIDETQKEHKDLQEAKENDHLLKDFLNDKQGMLKKLARDLVKLPPEDRKIFAESTAEGKFKIRSFGKEYGKPTWEMSAPNIKFNPVILQDFMDQGKIGKHEEIFNQNSSDDPSAADI